MTVSKMMCAGALCSVLALGACTDPGQLGASFDDPNRQTKNGALLGAGAGALVGALSKGDGNRSSGALKGAVLGGAVGAGVGYALDRQEADLRKQLNNPNVNIQNTGDRLIVTLPQDILFGVDSAVVSPTLQGDLAALASNLQSYPASTIQVVGHTDADGDAAYNQGLSQRRADAVSQILINQGVPFGRIQTFGRPAFSIGPPRFSHRGGLPFG